GADLTALRLTAQAGRITDKVTPLPHFADDHARRGVIHTLHQTATTVQVAHDVTHEVFRGHDLDLHHRLQQDGLGLLGAFLDGHGRGHLERSLVRVHVMVGTIVQSDLDVDHRVTRDDTILQLFEGPFLDRRHVFLGNHTTDDFGSELEVHLFVAFLVRLSERLDTQPDMTELTATTGLTNELAFLLDTAADGFAVGDLRLADVGFHLELATHAVNDDIQVQFTHTGDDGLTSLFVGLDAEGRIFLSQLAQSNTHLLLVSLGLGLHCHGDNRLRELHALENQLVVDVAQGVTSGDVLQTDTGSDIASVHFLDLFARVRVHLYDTTHTLLLLLDRVIDTVTRVQHA